MEENPNTEQLGASPDISKENQEDIYKKRPQLWRKGQSGNPAGKPKGTLHFKTLFLRAIEEIGAQTSSGEKIKWDAVIVRKLLKMASDGNIRAIEVILDRVDGKPAQSLDVTTQGDKINFTRELSDAELLDLAAGSEGGAGKA